LCCIGSWYHFYTNNHALFLSSEDLIKHQFYIFFADE
jgi:hypothetical protein